MQQALAVFLRCSSQETKTSDRLSVFRTLHWCSWFRPDCQQHLLDEDKGLVLVADKNFLVEIMCANSKL